MHSSIHVVAIIALTGFLVMFRQKTYKKLIYSVSKLPYTLYPKSAFYASTPSVSITDSFSGAEIVLEDQHSLVLVFGVSKNHQSGHTIYWTRGGLQLSPGSLNNSEYQAYVHSAKMVDWVLQETMLVAHRHRSSNPGVTASCNIMPSRLLTFVAPHT